MDAEHTVCSTNCAVVNELGKTKVGQMSEVDSGSSPTITRATTPVGVLTAASAVERAALIEVAKTVSKSSAGPR